MRIFGTVIVLYVLALGGCGLFYDWVGGDFSGLPSDLRPNVSPGALRIIEDAFGDLGEQPVRDFHVHLITRDVHPDWLSWWHPVQRARSMVYLSAAGVELSPHTEEDYVARLVDLSKGFPHPVRLFVLAMDHT